MSYLVTALICFYATLSRGADWVSVKPGLSYATWSYANPPLILHATRLDLRQPRFRVELSREEQRGSLPTVFASRMNATALVNASYFNSQYSSLGVTVSEGKEWNAIYSRDEVTGLLACTADNICSIKHTYSNVIQPSWYTVVSGIHSLVRNGIPRASNEDLKCPSFCQSLNPRTAVGLSADHQTLYFVVVEGRREDSVGISLASLGQEMKLLGAANALNLDGGGSSEMVIGGKLINQRPLNELEERPVSTALGIVEP